jgi:hypothetical protein
VIGLIVGAEYNALTTLSGIPAMVMAPVKLIAITFSIIVNPFDTNDVNTAEIHS